MPRLRHAVWRIAPPSSSSTAAVAYPSKTVPSMLSSASTRSLILKIASRRWSSGPACSARADVWCLLNSAVITGPIAKSELDIRCTTGFFLFVPPGFDQEVIKAAGLTLVRSEDRTSATAEIAARWHAARIRHAAVLEREEGADRFAKLQRYYATAAELASSRRLSRFVFVAEKAKALP